MKRLLTLAILLASVSGYAQGILDRFKDPEKGNVVFIEKGHHAFGISGGYRSFNAQGDADANAGYALFSLINVGDGRFQTWSVTPSFSWFPANDLSLGVSLDYDGYRLDTDLNLDFREILSTTSPDLNVTISNRNILRNSLGASFVARKYMSFFGSRTFAVFGEGRLFGNYFYSSSMPRNTEKAFRREKISDGIGIGAKLAAGLAVKLRDGSAITVSIPIFGVSWSGTNQTKTTIEMVDVTDGSGNVIKTEPHTTTSKSFLHQFNASRNTDILGIQFGFVRYIEPKRK